MKIIIEPGDRVLVKPRAESGYSENDNRWATVQEKTTHMSAGLNIRLLVKNDQGDLATVSSVDLDLVATVKASGSYGGLI